MIRASRRSNTAALIAILGTGLLLRLFVLPWSMTVEADAVSRVLMAQRWLLHPAWISHGVWGPLHFYLVALALEVGRDQEYAPIVLNIVFAVGTAFVLYLFASREFDASIGLFVAAAYSLCPVVFRNSLMTISEIPFAFFVALAMLQLSRARDLDRGFGPAIWGGFWLTCAAALRYEAWVLIPLYAVLLWRKPIALLAFVSTALLFPIGWMVGNFRFYGDPLYSVHWATHWQLDVDGGHANGTLGQMARRLLFFPQAVFTGLTPLASAFGLVGIWAVVRRGKQTAWILPLVAITLVFMCQATTGALLMRARYSILLVVMFLPFAGTGWRRVSRRLGHGTLLAWLSIGMMLPLSYAREALALTGSTRLTEAIPADIAAVPRLNPRIDRLARLVRQQQAITHGGVIFDFWAWDETYYAALITRVSVTRLFLMPGGQNEPLDTAGLSELLSENRTGLIVLDLATSARHWILQGNTLRFPELPEVSLRIAKLLDIDEFAVYRYTIGEIGVAGEAPRRQQRN